jgi:hypothetical protein
MTTHVDFDGVLLRSTEATQSWDRRPATDTPGAHLLASAFFLITTSSTVLINLVISDRLKLSSSCEEAGYRTSELAQFQALAR